VTSRFELFVALRYLRAKRKQAVISVITAISIIGVTAGVMALIIALAINNGFRNTLQRNLLGAAAHVNILEKEPKYGIENWPDKIAQARKLPHVIAAAPVLYEPVFLSGTIQSKGAFLKGVNVDSELAVSDMLRNLKQGSAQRLNEAGKIPCILLGSRLSQDGGMLYNSVVTVISPQGELTPIGPRPKYAQFRVCGIFESGFYDFDANWAYISLQSAQKLMSLENVISAIELKLDDIYSAPAVAADADKMFGPTLVAQTWMEQNGQLLNALRMERAVTVVTIGLIQLVAALNILIALVMMVMERYRDIAVLMSMGARQSQIRNIFMFEGVVIGVTGTILGLIAGHVLSYLADRNRWIQLDEQVYALSFVPFEPRLVDSFWVAGIAILVSFLATLYPARSAARIAPVEVLRYE
jgi:lipoprotein-releasing system permease protein